MKISWNWLADYVDLDGLDVDEVAERLTMAGLEVDGVHRIGDDLAPVVVGEIRSIAPHPDADKLVLCQVVMEAPSGAESGQPVQIVCGASNMKEGDRVPVIPAGETLPDGTRIKRGKIRGQLSNGMMCSRAELGLGDDHSGLMILPGDTPVGVSLAEALELRDAVLDLSLTPNRGDCQSHLGVAREVAALYGRARRYPGSLGEADPLGAQATVGDPPADEAGAYVEVDIRDVEGCPRYAAAVVLDVAVGPSPPWMQRRLEAIGQRPVNNLVDVTNYVMFETGQPLHAFDLDELPKRDGGRARILVRRSEDGETMVSIDHVERELGPDDIVITDGEAPIAVAGVMGGVDTEVSDTTRNLLLECAHFNPRRIRRSARRLGMSTESSHRFERVVDPEGVPRALRRAVELVLATRPEGAEGSSRVARGMVDAYPAPWQPHEVVFRPGRCRDLLGVELSRHEMLRLLSSIDVPCDTPGDRVLSVRPPSFRPDLEREVDLIEEIGRLYGIDRLEATLPVGELGFEHRMRERGDIRPQTVVPDEELRTVERLRDRIADAGLLEAVNYAFVSAAAIEAMGFADGDARSRPVRVQNPLSEEWAVMRTTLLPGLVSNARHNWSHQARSIALYEIGPVFFEDAQSETGVREEQRMAALVTGRRPGQMGDEERPWDGFDLKSVLEGLLSELGVAATLRTHDGAIAQLHPGVGVRIELGGEAIGQLGQLHPGIAETFELSEPVYVLDVSLDALLGVEVPTPQFEPIARFPAATRDVALVVPQASPYRAIEEAVAGFGNALVESVELLSVYRGDPIPEGRQSVALSITYRSSTGSLTDKKVDAVHQRLTDHVCAAVGGDLR